MLILSKSPKTKPSKLKFNVCIIYNFLYLNVSVKRKYMNQAHKNKHILYYICAKCAAIQTLHKICREKYKRLQRNIL